MSAICLHAARYRYVSGTVVGPVDLTVRRGELVLLSGPSGGGKSTVLRLAAGLLGSGSQGERSGRVELDGEDPVRRARPVAWVGQEPDDAVIGTTLLAEAAFGAECAGLDAPEAHARDALRRVGLADLAGTSPAVLSGGQRQRLAIAAALSGGADVLLLDEPLAHLDPAGADELLRTLRALADGGAAVLLVEHRVDSARRYSDRVLWIAGGRLIDTRPATPHRVGATPTAPRDTQPTHVSLRAARAGWPGRADVLRDIDEAVHAGERLALMGPNGAGKSTLLQLLGGGLRLRGGVRRVADGVTVVAVPQNPDLALYCDTVRAELAYALVEHGATETEVRDTVSRVSHALGVSELLDRPPQSLSRGQRLRVAVGAALAARPSLLLLDEPTAGQDAEHVERMFAALADGWVDARGRPGAVVFACHDADVLARWATRVREVVAGPEAVAAAARDPGGLPTDARPRIVALFFLGVLALALEGPVGLGVVAAPLFAATLANRHMSGWRLRFLALCAGLAWTTSLSQSLFWAGWPRTPLFVLSSTYDLIFYKEGALHGLVQATRFVAVTSAGLLLSVTTPSDRLIAALVAARVPFGLGLMAAAAMRAIPAVGAEVVAVRLARAARGRPLLARAPWAWIALEARLLLPVAVRALRRARAMADSLDTRGFHPTRARRKPPPAPRWEWALAVGAVVVASAALAARLAYVAYGLEIYYNPHWRDVYGFVRAWM